MTATSTQTTTDPSTGVPMSSTARTNTPDVKNGTSTTITVKRCCSGCNEPIGDVTEAEMDAVMAGRPLPSTVAEHGCEPKAKAPGQAEPSATTETGATA